MSIIPNDIRDIVDRWARLDPEARARVCVGAGQPVTADDATALIERLDRRDGCHSRHESVEAAARLLLDALAVNGVDCEPVAQAVDDLRDVLARVGARGDSDPLRSHEVDRRRVDVVRASVDTRTGCSRG